jgi:hypothetical protein
MSVCLFSVQVAVLQRADSPSKGPSDCVKDSKTERKKTARAQQRAVEPLVSE